MDYRLVLGGHAVATRGRDDERDASHIFHSLLFQKFRIGDWVLFLLIDGLLYGDIVFQLIGGKSLEQVVDGVGRQTKLSKLLVQ